MPDFVWSGSGWWKYTVVLSMARPETRWSTLSYVSAYGRRTAPSGRIASKKNNPMATQSEEGRGLGSWTSISLSQQTGLPSPAFVQRISVPHTEQRYLFPSWLMDYYLQQKQKIQVEVYHFFLALTSALTSAYNVFISSIPSVDRSNGLSHYHLLSQ